jgi:sterol desaturase/sphingolipid hydroxylase (fatty acid hydroxylase superfamily)
VVQRVRPEERNGGAGAPSASGAVDLTRPLVEQVGELGGAYWDWVHQSITPAQVATLQQRRVEAGEALAARWPSSLRLFRSPLLEAMSHIRWWLVLVVWIPVVLLLSLGAVSGRGLQADRALGWAAAGLVLWTLAEYLLHRFVFHYTPRSGLGNRLHFVAHGIHHLDPWDPTRLVFPPLAGMLIAGTIFGLLSLLLPLGPALALMSGFLCGYIGYDLTHYFTHHGRPRSRWGRFLRAYHMSHHHRHQHRMYGVSQPLWDLVFRTGRPGG